MFEFVYLARPIRSWTASRCTGPAEHGRDLAQRLISSIRPNEIDVVIRSGVEPALAMQLAQASASRTAKAS